MASYRYERDIDPKDLQPRKQRQYTRKERWANWWDYNLKWVIIIGIIVVFFGYNFIGQYFFTVHADYNVAVVAPHYLPEATQTALQDALAAYGEDLNGDGKVVVKLNVYTMNFGSDDSDAYLDMAGTTKLSTDIQGALSSIFILYDPAGFQSTTGTLRYLDGSLPQSDADNDWWNMVYHWDDCPVLAGLDLGDYTSDAVQNDSGSSQELLSHYYIGIRGAWTKDADDLLSGGEALWQALTAGAARRTRARIGRQGEEDLYSFVVTEGGRHVVDTRGPPDLVMSLFGPDSETALLASDDNTGVDDNPSIAVDLVPGTYFVRVRHQLNDASGVGLYTIKVHRPRSGSR